MQLVDGLALENVPTQFATEGLVHRLQVRVVSLAEHEQTWALESACNECFWRTTFTAGVDSLQPPRRVFLNELKHLPRPLRLFEVPPHFSESKRLAEPICLFNGDGLQLKKK